LRVGMEDHFGRWIRQVTFLFEHSARTWMFRLDITPKKSGGGNILGCLTFTLIQRHHN
jgi:hypothetical protein